MENSIVEIYSKATYLPFLKYCQERRYQTMEDLARCPFHLLGKEPGFTPLLASRVKAVYDSYCKTQGIAQPVRQAVEPVGKAFAEPELVKWLYAYFQKHQEKLVTVSELVKELSGRAGRPAVLKVLQNVSWCSAVDKNTFFYSGKQEEA